VENNQISKYLKLISSGGASRFKYSATFHRPIPEVARFHFDIEQSPLATNMVLLEETRNVISPKQTENYKGKLTRFTSPPEAALMNVLLVCPRPY